MSSERIDSILTLTGPAATVQEEHPADEAFLSYRTGSLDDEHTARVERHLVSCEACRLVLEELSRPVSPERARAVKAQLARTAPFVARRRIVTTALFAAAAVFLFMLLRPATEQAASLRDVRFAGPEGAIREVRSSTRSASSPVFDSNSRITFRVSWHEDFSGEGASVLVWEKEKNGELRKLPVEVEIVPHGGAHVTISAGTAFGPRARDLELHLVLWPGKHREVYRIHYEGGK
jgi:hypothetical protein